MTLKLSTQFSRAMKRARDESRKLSDDFGVGVWITARRHEKTCEKIGDLSKRVKALKARRAAVA